MEYTSPQHVVPDEVKPYIEQLSEKELELHNLAIKELGSSYFVEFSRGYLEWLAKQKYRQVPKC